MNNKLLVQARECYRNYYKYEYDSNGDFIIKVNDIANDNYKVLYMR